MIFLSGVIGSGATLGSIFAMSSSTFRSPESAR
jgi:hypothetical protein